MKRALLLVCVPAFVTTFTVGGVLSYFAWQFVQARQMEPIAQAPAKQEIREQKVDPPAEKKPSVDEKKPTVDEKKPTIGKEEKTAKKPDTPAAGSPLDRLDRKELAPIYRDGLPAEVVAVIPIPKKGTTFDLAFRADGKRLALARSEGTIELWDLDGVKPAERAVLRLDVPGGMARRVAISDDGRWLASIHGLPGQRVQLWKLNDNTATPVASRDFRRVEHVAFHPDGKTLICGSNDGHLFAVSDKGLEPVADPLIGPNSCFQFNKNGSTFACVVFNQARNGPLYGSEIKFWKVTDKRFEEFQLIQQDRTIKAFAVSPDGKKMATAALDLKVRLWDLTQRPATEVTLFSTSTWVKSVYFTPDGVRVIVVANMNDVIVWNVETGAEEKAWRLTSLKGGTSSVGISACALAPDGRHLAVSTNGHGTMIVRLPISTK